MGSIQSPPPPSRPHPAAFCGLTVQYPVSVRGHNVPCLKSEHSPSERLPPVNYFDPPIKKGGGVGVSEPGASSPDDGEVEHGLSVQQMFVQLQLL